MQQHLSNFREFWNLLEAVQHLFSNENVDGVEIFLFTNNTTVEGCFFTVTSSSRVLFELVLDLRHLEMIHGFRLSVNHISSTCMIKSGIDGLSRGDLNKGLMSGSSPLEFVALHLSATDRSPFLVAWLQTWMPRGSQLLTPEGWFG